MERFTPGQEIETTVIQISNDCVFVDLSAKSEGVIDKAEFLDANGNCKINEGDKIKVFFLGEVHGEFRFTSKIAGQNADSEMLENAFKNRIPVEGKVEKEIKGGFEVTIGSTRAFCPFSQMGFRQKEEPSYYVGRVFTFIITEYKENGKNLLVSNRQVLQNEYDNHIESLKTKITEGTVLEGTVKSLQDYGAFIDLDGFQALLPVSEVSYERVKNVSEVLNEGDSVTVKVIKADWEHNRISVSLKALQEDPWNKAAQQFQPGDKIEGKISRVADFGIFVNLAKGIDGLVHISELKVDKNTNIKKVYSVGQDFAVQVKDVNMNDKRISLIPATAAEEEETAAKYLSNQKDDGDTYNPFAALLKK